MESINKREAWNKGKLVGQKPPLKPKDIWAIRIHLQNAHAGRDLAMFNLAIDSKLRGCDLVSLRVRDVTHGSQVLPRAIVIQRKTQRPVQFELTEPARVAVAAWLEKSQLRGSGYIRQGKFVESFGLSAIAHGILLISSGTLFIAVGWKGKFGFATGLFALAGILLSFAVLYISKHHA